ncbi:MAG: hypothetical protein JWL88_310, partial [Parcubacteria group bacterium]|nr:hypothetical protein [Parcubacteria group bacterium]
DTGEIGDCPVTDSKTPQEQVHELGRLLLRNGITETHIAASGCMTRQSINAHGLGRPNTTKPQTLGFGFAILRAAFQNGYVPEVLSILSGREVSHSTLLVAALLYPDLNDEEIKKLIALEDLVGVKPLPGNMIAATMETLRTPQK